MKLFDLTGKTILLTGASRGIGRTLAEGLRDQGAIVYGTGSKPSSIEWMNESGIHPAVADIREPNVMFDLISSIRSKHGRLDVLINNAGIATNTPASGFKEDELQDIIATNYTGVFRSCQAYYKLHKKDGGNIINVASILGMVGSPLASVYSGAKGGVIALTKALAIEWANNGYRVNALCPGFIETDMTTMITDKPHVKEQFSSHIPMKRIGKPNDLLGATVFLASDSSSYMTGQTLVIDGGITAQ